MTYICVELPDEGGEVAVLEVLGQEVPGELGRVPDDEAVVPGAPGHDVVRGRVVNHLVGLHEEGRRRRGGRPAVAHRGVRGHGRGRRGRGRGHWRRHRRGHRSRGRRRSSGSSRDTALHLPRDPYGGSSRRHGGRDED